MKADVEMLDDTAVGGLQPKSYIGRLLRRQGQYGSVSVVGTVAGTAVEYISEPKRLFPKDGTVETYGVSQHAGLSPGDWVEFDVGRNTRQRAAEYKVVHLRRIPRYAVLSEGVDAFYRTLLIREGWRGDRRPGLWALRISGDRLIIVDLELGKDGALRIPRTAAQSVSYYSHKNDNVARLDTTQTTEDAYLGHETELLGRFDWSDEADYVARVIRSLADVDDPQISDLIAWLELHQEAGSGKVLAAGVDHAAALDALRSGELAERLRADRELMKAYLDAAVGDEAVAAAVAEYARQGHTEARARLLTDLENELGRRRDTLVAAQKVDLAEQHEAAVKALDEEIQNLRADKLAESERALKLAQQRYAARMAQLDCEHQSSMAELEQQIHTRGIELAQIEIKISDATSALKTAQADFEAERARGRDAAAEVDRLLSVSGRLSTAALSATPAVASAIPFAFPDREAVSVGALYQSINGLAMLSAKGRELIRRMMVLMLSGELPILYGADKLDFVRLAGAVITPGRIGFMRADPTLISIEDVWARPGSGAPTIMAAATSASAKGGSILVAVTDVESSGARFWMPALADFLRSPARPRGLLVCALAGDLEHEEMKALPQDLAMLEIEGVFETGAFFGALALPGVAATQEFALDTGTTPVDIPAAARVISALGFEPSVGLVMRLARIAAEAATMIADDAAATKLTVAIAQDIHNQTR
jgi:hypothetical protein